MNEKCKLKSFSRNLHSCDSRDELIKGLAGYDDQFGIWTYKNNGIEKNIVLSDGFFNDSIHLLKTGDIIYINGDYFNSLFVATCNNNTVSISPINFDASISRELKLNEACECSEINNGVVYIEDYSDEQNIISGQFKKHTYTKDPDWYKEDIHNLVYKIKDQDHSFLISTALTSFNALSIKNDELQSLHSLLNNPPKIFFNKDRGSFCYLSNNELCEINATKVK
jgi:hypothetical protein